MARKSPPSRSKHDQEVKRIANQLERQGWNVKADIPGYETPVAIGKNPKVPDIEATKRGHRKLIEVETPKTVGRDRKQQETFRRHAGQKPNTTFDVVVTDE